MSTVDRGGDCAHDVFAPATGRPGSSPRSVTLSPTPTPARAESRAPSRSGVWVMAGRLSLRATRLPRARCGSNLGDSLHPDHRLHDIQVCGIFAVLGLFAAIDRIVGQSSSVLFGQGNTCIGVCVIQCRRRCRLIIDGDLKKHRNTYLRRACHAQLVGQDSVVGKRCKCLFMAKRHRLALRCRHFMSTL